MKTERIAEIRTLALTHQGKNKSADIILECLDAIQKLQRMFYDRTKPNVPTLSEVLHYAKEIGLSIDEATAFFDHHETYDWRGKKGPIRKWQAALRTWKRNAAKFEKDGKKPLNHFLL